MRQSRERVNATLIYLKEEAAELRRHRRASERRFTTGSAVGQLLVPMGAAALKRRHAHIVTLQRYLSPTPSADATPMHRAAHASSRAPAGEYHALRARRADARRDIALPRQHALRLLSPHAPVSGLYHFTMRHTYL